MLQPSPLAVFILSAIPFVWILFYCVALAFVLTRPADGNGGKRLAAIGITILLVTQIAAIALRYIITLASVSDTLTAHAATTAFTTILHIAGTSLIIAAVFKRRGTPDSYAESFPGQNRDLDNTNPFQPPNY